ncbi:8628_t:CDS:2, partial [Racocetra fulgida]
AFDIYLTSEKSAEINDTDLEITIEHLGYQYEINWLKSFKYDNNDKNEADDFEQHNQNRIEYDEEEKHNTITKKMNNRSYKPKFNNLILDLINSYFDEELLKNFEPDSYKDIKSESGNETDKKVSGRKICESEHCNQDESRAEMNK